MFERFAVVGITAHSTQCKKYVDESLGVVTALNPHIGYETASKLAKESLVTGQSVKELCIEQGYLTRSEIEEILDPLEMTTPGIAGKNYLLVRQ